MSGPRNGAAPGVEHPGTTWPNTKRDEHQRSGQDEAARRALQGALHLAARGYVLVPVTIRRDADGKKQSTFHHGWSRGGSSDPEVIRDWSAQHSGCSFAVLCGPSGVEVVDLDLAEGGPAWWTSTGLPVPEHVVDTPSGGLHLYYRRRPGDDPARRLVNNAGKVAPGVDGRTVGGLVYAPGSYVLGEEDRPYTARVELPEPHALQETPERVLALWRRSRSTPAATEPGRPAEDRRFIQDEAQTYVDRKARDLVLAAEYGVNVNDTINSAAVVVGHFVPEFWPEDQARAMLRRWVLEGPGARNGWTELDEADRRSIESGLRRGMSEPYARRTAPGSNHLADGVPVLALAPVPVALVGEPVSPFVDLGPFLRGEVVAAVPELGLERARDGLRLLYPGLAHLVMGETEGGKTWLALAHTAAEIAAGRTVAYVHAEETSPAGTIERLRLLGLSDDQIGAGLAFVALEGPLGAGAVEVIAARRPSLVVVDGYNEALTAHGLDIMKPDGPAAFRGRVVAPLARSGAAVVLLDHVVKDEARNGSGYPLGSVHKINAIDGAAFLLETVEAFGRGRRGSASLAVVKDRPGHLRTHGEPDRKWTRKFRLGVMAVDARPGEPFSLVLWPPVPEEEQEQNRAFDEEKVLSAAVKLIRASGAVSQNKIVEAAKINAKKGGQVVRRLIEDGRLQRHPDGIRLPDDRVAGSGSQDQEK